MATVTEVRFAHEDGALAHTLGELPELDARIVRESSTNPQQNVYYVRVDYHDPSRVATVLDADHTVADARPMPEFDDRRLIAVEFADDAKLVGPHVTRESGLVVDARSASPDQEPRGWRERWVLPDREAIRAVWQRARDEGFSFTLLEFHRSGRADGTDTGVDVLTGQQRRTLAAAYEQGYFAEPRETSLQELGEALDLSASAVGGRLKRGMKSLVGETLVIEGHHE